eukprot:CAMPEP_0194549704 /NCGR_PEP_ID=MMETSP0253-20130528/95341_1 /TAXON_ID=2966 /ORGANISM="Noctiluca scintillans" /LENGTH=60 /DNA_ID=CAMNT_0039397135 /DNA_START=608 /DNA_END=790 /DNA_ORIENTATION=-
MTPRTWTPASFKKVVPCGPMGDKGPTSTCTAKGAALSNEPDSTKMLLLPSLSPVTITCLR